MASANSRFSDYWYEPIDGAEGEYVPVEIAEDAYVSSDDSVETFYEPIYSEPAEDEHSSGLFGAQGGFSFGPFKINGGVEAGR